MRVLGVLKHVHHQKVTIEIAMFVVSTPKRTRLAMTSTPTTVNVQWLSVRLATQLENPVKDPSHFLRFPPVNVARATPSFGLR